MIKESLKQISFLALISLFFFVCGSLYLLGFWSTFDLDISNLVEIGEIPKSFILPFILSNIYVLIIMFFNVLTSHSKKDELVGIDNREWPSKKVIIIFDMILTIIIGLIPVIMFWYYDQYKFSSNYWRLWGAITGLLVAVKLNGIPFFKNLLPNDTLRLCILVLIVNTLCMSFAIGKAKSVDIYTNKSIQYASAKSDKENIEVPLTNDSTHLKLLGFLGNKYIVSSLDNKKIYILPQASINILTIEKIEEKKK